MIASCWGETSYDPTAAAAGAPTDASNGAGGHAAVSAGGSGTTDGDVGENAITESSAGDTPGGAGGVSADGGDACTWAQCIWRACGKGVGHCGDCFENDGDGLLDSEDPDCLGPCDRFEDSWGRSPGEGTCGADCYFDANDTWDDDQCIWSHHCDPWSKTYPPYTLCLDDPDAGIFSTGVTCDQAFAAQSETCAKTCGPLVPNGCDCFGCCEVPQAPTPIWLGSDLQTPCTKETAADPTRCFPCTIVPSCFNPCETCELCLGKTALPAECGSTQQCPPGIQPCGLADQPCCPDETYCISGCCQPTPPKKPWP